MKSGSLADVAASYEHATGNLPVTRKIRLLFSGAREVTSFCSFLDSEIDFTS